jgi:hypothetical protein
MMAPPGAGDQRIVAALGIVVHLVGIADEAVLNTGGPDQRVVAAAGIIVHELRVAK